VAGLKGDAAMRTHAIDPGRVYTLTQARAAAGVDGREMTAALRGGALRQLPPVPGRCTRPSMRPARRILGAELIRWLGAREGNHTPTGETP
jgi:hypothetical protein